MPQDATEIRVAGTGKVWVAPYGTALPASTTVFATPAAEYVDLGYTTEEGVTFSDATNAKDIMAWQSRYPVRRLVESYEGSASFELLQWNKAIFEQILHGVVSEPTAGVFEFTPTRAGVVAEKTLLIDFEDGALDYRVIIPRAGLADPIEMQLVSMEAASLPTAWGVIGGDAAGPFIIRTNDANFDPTP